VIFICFNIKEREERRGRNDGTKEKEARWEIYIRKGGKKVQTPTKNYNRFYIDF
jgi:hypothetical protein